MPKNPPCPPYNLSQEDVLAQAPTAEEDDLWTELERIQDPGVLREKFYAEHQMMMDQLNLAGRFGLELQHSLEQAQRAERESYSQIQALQDENLILQSRVNQTHALSAHLSGTEDEVQNLTNENESLQKELDGCRRELKMFRKELDNLVEQMADMGTEVLDAKNKVSTYSRRLNEVEQELNSTQELNVNLQEQLQVALEKQKQTQSTTAQAVKIMQNELGRVVSDSGTLRSTLVELENRQEKCEGRVVEMISNTKEYAHLLEEAQTTIQTMRIESDMDGRGWGGHSPTSWDPRPRRGTGQLSTLAMEDPQLKTLDLAPDEMDPQAWGDNQAVAPGMSLGMELGHEPPQNDWDDNRAETETDGQREKEIVVSPPSTPAQLPEPPKQPTPAPSPPVPVVAVLHKETQTPPLQEQPTPSTSKDTRKLSTGVLSTELQQRLEEHNTLQTAISATSTSSRPPWNPSVALENELINPSRNRSRSASRGPRTSSRSSSRSVSQASLNPLVSSSGSSFRAPKAPLPTSTPSTDAVPVRSGKRQGSLSSGSVAGTNVSADRRPRSRTTPSTVEKNSTPGLKHLITADNNTNGSSNVATKTKTSAPSKPGSVSSITPSSTTRATMNTGSSTKSTENSANSKTKGRMTPSSSSSSIGSNNHKSSAQASTATEGAPKGAAAAARPSPPSNRNAKKRISSTSLTASPGALTTTTATGRTTPRSHPMSPSPRATSRASMSSPSSSPAPLSPSIASKKLKAISGSGSGDVNGTGSRRSSVTSLPLPLPVPATEEGHDDSTPITTTTITTITDTVETQQ
ncbi:hypothetical protein BGZ79_010540 [Entomortierella chlamydospora]|nr:hypothetical protein BGZ79_010540 [Entomortierella chlamydospora]